jgi:hypothetical protein
MSGLSVCLPTCLPVLPLFYLSACLLVCLSACLPTLLARLPVSLSVCLAVSHTWCAEGLMVSDTLHAVLPAGFAWNPRRVECGLNSIQSRPRGPLSLLLLGPSNTFLVVQFRRRNGNVALFRSNTLLVVQFRRKKRRSVPEQRLSGSSVPEKKCSSVPSTSFLVAQFRSNAFLVVQFRRKNRSSVPEQRRPDSSVPEKKTWLSSVATPSG